MLTRSRAFHPEGVDVVHTKEEVLALGDVIIFGGAEIYRQFLDVVDRMYITEIDLETEGDTFFRPGTATRLCLWTSARA